MFWKLENISNFFLFSTKHNNTFHFYISAFSLRSQNNFDFIIITIQQKSTVPFYQHKDVVWARLWSQRTVAGLGVESKKPDSQSHEKIGPHPPHVWPKSITSPSPVWCHKYASSRASTAHLGDSPQNKHNTSTLPYAQTLAENFPRMGEQPKQLHCHLQQREGQDHLWPLNKDVLYHTLKGRPSWTDGPSNPGEALSCIAPY